MKEIVLGDEAVALGAVHAGLSVAYGYPGTPSTEIMEFLQGRFEKDGAPIARWCSNEKTALEGALGVSFAGKRAIVTMKHVGLNVASDAFMNGALLGIKGGLVIAVADDPGMHSSQNEQDSRFYATFALVPCMEPRNQQEAYDMTREAFEISEKNHVPVLMRLVTRLSHARAGIETITQIQENPLEKISNQNEWMLLPAFARMNYENLIEKQGALLAWSQDHRINKLEVDSTDSDFAVITCGLGGNYYEENLEDLILSNGGRAPSRLHIGIYPIPVDSIQILCKKAKKVLVIEEGQPVVEEKLRGILNQTIEIYGKLNGKLPRTGELDADNVRAALSLAPLKGIGVSIPPLPKRPPQLCSGCPHADSYAAIKSALADYDEREKAICADIGCYSLGAAPPHSAIESIVCMGASIGMARGAAEAGIKAALAVIGDSTFLHSGITGLVDAVSYNSNITVVILDNSTVAMTGCQTPMLPSSKLEPLVLGLGVQKEHFAILETKPQNIEQNAARLKHEIEYNGLSVVIFRRECLEAARIRKKREKDKNRTT